jgi:hypothetical protein
MLYVLPKEILLVCFSLHSLSCAGVLLSKNVLCGYLLDLCTLFKNHFAQMISTKAAPYLI